MCIVHVELKSHDRIRIFMLRIYFEQKAIVYMYFLCFFSSSSSSFSVCVCTVRPSLKSLEWVQATVKLKNDASNLNLVFR